MNIIHTTDMSQDAKYRRIRKSVSIIEEFGLYGILIVERHAGDYCTNDMHFYKNKFVGSIQEAMYHYVCAGGEL